MEVWKYWMQLWGAMPTDEMQKLRAENELLKVQLEMLKQKEQMQRQMADIVQQANSFARMQWPKSNLWGDDIWSSSPLSTNKENDK